MVPPPTPVTTPSQAKPTMSICLRDATSAPVSANTQGDYATLTDCEYDPVRQCGWKYACAADGDPETLCKLVPGPDGVYGTAEECQCVSPMGPPGPTCVCGFSSTVQGDAPFHSVTQCQADATDMCGWKYTCPPPPLSFAIEAGGKTGLTVGDGCNPAFVYIALGPAFVAYTSAAENWTRLLTQKPLELARPPLVPGPLTTVLSTLVPTSWLRPIH